MSRTCCCYYNAQSSDGSTERRYLPQVKLDAHTTVLSTASRTTLRQRFINTDKDKAIGEIRYVFPLYDGASIVDFKCQIGDRTIFGLVKERSEARKTYEEAKARGEKAALLEQLPAMADVFHTTVSDIPAGGFVDVTITYILELKHDAEVDGIRFSMPTHIAPRYHFFGRHGMSFFDTSTVDEARGEISVTVDVSMAEGIPIKKIISPSHPVEVSLGTLSTDAAEANSSVSKASATLALGTAQLEKDFVLQIVAKDIGIPQAILETHPTLPNQRALMTTLVPKLNLKPQKPEIIFIADRSGSMEGTAMTTLISALQVFLKSIPVGCMFNICSFGFSYEFLWPKSKLYGRETLAEAVKYVRGFDANLGGTETLNAVRAAVKSRHQAMHTELMLLTDGDISRQDVMFGYIEQATRAGNLRVFPIGIGGGVSSALIEGVARAGKGFAQMVGNHEKLDAKIVRMLKGALTPHIKDYRLEIKYEDDSVESVADSLRLNLQIDKKETEVQESEAKDQVNTKPISLYDPEATEEHPKAGESEDDDRLKLMLSERPKILQTPREIPALYPFNRTCVYLLLSPQASHLKPKSVVLKATSPDGPLELEISVQHQQQPGEMIHQLAARKATQELEEGRGWLSSAVLTSGKLLKEQYPAQYELLQKREAVRLGVEFQVGGKYCSFVAVEANEAQIAEARRKALEKSMKGNETRKEPDTDANDLDDYGIIKSGSVSPVSVSSSFMEQYDNNTEESYRGPGSQSYRQTGTKRHRKIVPLHSDVHSAEILIEDSEEECNPWKYEEEDEEEAPAPKRAQLASKACRKIPTFIDDEDAEVQEEDDSEETYRELKLEEVTMEEEDDIGLDFGASDSWNMPDGLENFGAPDSWSMPATFNPIPDAGASFAGPGRARYNPSAMLQRLIGLQSFEGSWDMKSSPWDAIGVRPEQVDAIVDELVAAHSRVGREKMASLVSTAVFITFIEENMADQEETWELVVGKARDWMEESADRQIVEEVLMKVKNCVRGV